MLCKLLFQYLYEVINYIGHSECLHQYSKSTIPLLQIVNIL